MSQHNNSSEVNIKHCWELIQEGIASRKSNYHTMTLGYLSNNYPRCINLIPRKLCEKDAIINVHTDIRSQKVAHLKNQPHVSCLFWCKYKKIQLSLSGVAKLRHRDELTLETWKSMRQMSKICYCADIPPSSKSSERTTGFTEKTWEDRQIIAETMHPYDNFAIVQIHIRSVERLYLSASGHEKIKFTLGPDNHWTHQWLAP